MITLIPFIYSCGPKPSLIGTMVSIDPTFQPYVDRFIEVAKEQGKDIQINNLIVSFDKKVIEAKALGICTTGNGITPTITINPEAWKYWDDNNMESSKEQVMFHELGHCVLNREHNEVTVKTLDTNSNIQVSIMFPYFMDSKYYEGNYNHYVNELFYPMTTGDLYANNDSEYPTQVWAVMTENTEEVNYKDFTLVKCK